MKILHVMQCANLGGMEQTTLLRMKHLIKRGHSCNLVSLNPIGALSEKLARTTIVYKGLRYRKPWGLPTLWSMHKAFSESQCDSILMSGHNVAAQLVVRGIQAKRKVLAVHYHHKGVKSLRSWRMIYGLAYECFDTITFASTFIRNEALDILPALADKSIVLPNPFELPPAPSSQRRQAIRSRMGLRPDDLVIGNAGWLIHRKRFDIFLRVCAEIKQHFPTLRILIAGDGPLRGHLEGLAKELGVSGITRFLGWLPDIEWFYSALDLLLFNSDWDALGRTPIEATALGTPVVASVVHGGLSEMVPGGSIRIIDAHDVPRLSCLCRTVLEAPGAARNTALETRTRLSLYCPLKDALRLEGLLCST